MYKSKIETTNNLQFICQYNVILKLAIYLVYVCLYIEKTLPLNGIKLFLSNVIRHSKETKTTVKQIANINNNKNTDV